MLFTNYHGITPALQGRKFGSHVIAQGWVKGVRRTLLLPVNYPSPLAKDMDLTIA